MLRVGEAQLAALEVSFAEDFAKEMAGVLIRSFPGDCDESERDELVAFVRSSVGRARALGARLEADFRRHVVTEFVLGTEAMDPLVDEQRRRLAEKHEIVSPTDLIIAMYQAMLARCPAEDPPPKLDEDEVNG